MDSFAVIAGDQPYQVDLFAAQPYIDHDKGVVRISNEPGFLSMAEKQCLFLFFEFI